MEWLQIGGDLTFHHGFVGTGCSSASAAAVQGEFELVGSPRRCVKGLVELLPQVAITELIPGEPQRAEHAGRHDCNRRARTCEAVARVGGQCLERR
jgi:hypothetical protein